MVIKHHIFNITSVIFLYYYYLWYFITIKTATYPLLALNKAVSKTRFGSGSRYAQGRANTLANHNWQKRAGNKNVGVKYQDWWSGILLANSIALRHDPKRVIDQIAIEITMGGKARKHACALGVQKCV